MTMELPIDLQTKQAVLIDLAAIVSAMADTHGYEMLAHLTVKEVIEAYRTMFLQDITPGRAGHVAKANRLLAWIAEDPTR